ncbi:hypothetical protein ACFL0V_05295 [Nanoarchaeota archaeon]
MRQLLLIPLVYAALNFDVSFEQAKPYRPNTDVYVISVGCAHYCAEEGRTVRRIINSSLCVEGFHGEENDDTVEQIVKEVEDDCRRSCGPSC